MPVTSIHAQLEFHSTPCHLAPPSRASVRPRPSTHRSGSACATTVCVCAWHRRPAFCVNSSDKAVMDEDDDALPAVPVWRDDDTSAADAYDHMKCVIADALESLKEARTELRGE
jgi:hypothetical protein